MPNFYVGGWPNFIFLFIVQMGILGIRIDPNVGQPPSLLRKVYKISFSLQSRRINTGLPLNPPLGVQLTPIGVVS